MKIAICDDEQHIHDMVGDMLRLYSEENHITMDIVHYHSAKQLLEKREELDALLLDIEMPETDGIEAAFKLRDRGLDYKIIMLTAREDRYRDAFKIGAFRFVPKPIEKPELYKAIDDVREHLAGMEKVTVFCDGISYRIAQRDILYIEADRSSSLVFTDRDAYRSEQSLAKWLEILDSRMFFQSHRSYIVNMGKIEKIEKNVIRLVNGDKAAVSKRLRMPLLHAYMAYDTRRR